MAEKNITMVRGDTLSFGMEFEGLDQDLDAAYMTCRNGYEGELVFQKSLGNGITKASANQYRVRVAPEDTATVVPNRYYYDLQIQVNSDIFTILKGVLFIEADVTVNA